jgi:hypothetical protein
MPTSTTYDALIDPAAYIETGALNCEQTALNRLYYQWQDQPNWQALMRVIGQVFQRVEDLSLDVLQQFQLATATGIQLDAIGALFGIARGSLTEEQYRLAIIAKGSAMISSGTHDELIGILQVMFPTAEITISDAYPAAITVTLSDVGINLALVAFVATIFLPVVAAGVGVNFVVVDPNLVGGWPSSTGAAPPQYILGQWSSSTGPNPDLSARSLWSFSI